MNLICFALKCFYNHFLYNFSFKKGSSGKKLRHLDLSGCLYITDQTLQRLSSALGHIPCHMTETVDQVTDHVTKPDRESANENEGCVNCQERRKNGSYESEKQERKVNSCRLSSNKVMTFVGCGKEVIEESRRDNANKCCRLGEECDGRLSPDNGMTFCSSRGCDKRFDCKWARNKNGCCCCDNDDRLSTVNRETPQVADTEETHDEKFDNEITDTQDRSWIRGEGHTNEMSRTENNDLSTKENDQYREIHDDAYQTATQTQDQKNIKNLNRGPDCDVGIVPNNVIIQTESTPGQTYLPDFFFLPNLKPEKDGGIDAENKTVLPVVTSDGINDIEGADNSDRALEFLSLSGCYQITEEGLG